MRKQHPVAPEHTAVRVALWRELHTLLDSRPYVLEDHVGFKLIAPDENWRQRPDMNLEFTRGVRSSIVGRSRFIEDTLKEEHKHGVTQHVILGAGLDTFAQREPDLASQLQIFEVDQPGPQQWKKQRLTELGFGIPNWLHFVPVDFEAGESWWDQLISAGFDQKKPAVVVSTGVSMYLTRETNMSTLRQIAKLKPGSTFAMTFMLPLDMLIPEERKGQEMAMAGAKASGTPFISLFAPDDILGMAKEAGFKSAEEFSGKDMNQRYFAGRSDGLRTANAQSFLVAKT